MLGLEMLDVAIGMIFIFLLLSLICTAINEFIESFIKLRAVDLEQGIREILDDPDRTGIVQKFWNHHLINSLFRGNYHSAQIRNVNDTSFKKKRYSRGSDLPSYIHAKNFALVLMDILLPANTTSAQSNTPASTTNNLSGASGALAPARDNTPQGNPAVVQPNPLSELRTAVITMTNMKVKGALLTILDTASDDIVKARKGLESWYNSSMDRVAGWYKRRVHKYRNMHKIIFSLVGIVLIISSCGSSDVDSESTADSAAVFQTTSTFVGDNPNNDKYICGFTGSFAYADNFPSAAGVISNDDSVIERTFAMIWRNVIGGRPDAIRIAKDADQNNNEYRYAAAKGAYSELANIIRYVYYKSNDLSPLLKRDNGWHLKAIALHEFAHHINCDPFTGVSRDVAELGADDYAGFMMGSRLKATLDTALLAFSTFTEEHPTNGYPDRQRRIAAVKAGWERAQISARLSLVSAFIQANGINRGFSETEKQIEYRILRRGIDNNGSLETLDDTSTLNKAKLNINASGSPGEFFVDSNYLYFKETDSMRIIGRVAHSNRPEYRQMVYDNFYNYMYIDSNNVLITYRSDSRDPSSPLKPIIIGRFSQLRKR